MSLDIFWQVTIRQNMVTMSARGLFCFVLFSEIHLGVLLEKSENGEDYMP
jgi:hypothetical protein